MGVWEPELGTGFMSSLGSALAAELWATSRRQSQLNSSDGGLKRIRIPQLWSYKTPRWWEPFGPPLQAGVRDLHWCPQAWWELAWGTGGTSWCMLASRRPPWWHRSGEVFLDHRMVKLYCHLAVILDDSTSFLTGERKRESDRCCWFWIKALWDFAFPFRQAGTHTDRQQRDTVNHDTRRLHLCKDILAFPARKHRLVGGLGLCNWPVTSFHFLCADPLTTTQFRKCVPGLQPSSGLP